MVELVREKNDDPRAYQQALDDFGITELLSHISNYVDADFNAALMNLEKYERECLAAILIQRLTQSLNGKLIASYLNAIRHGDSDVICDPTNLEMPPPSIDLPTNFSDSITPRYGEGDRVMWRTGANNTDKGVAIGHYYAYAQHQCQWAVRYLVKLDSDSPSVAWTVADTAWEEDLEPATENGWRSWEAEEAKEKITPMNGTGYKSLNPVIHPYLRTSPGNYNPERTDVNNLRSLTQREQNLIELYSHCQLGMTPKRFYAKWEVGYEQIASICSRSTSTVRCWFTRGRNYRRPTPTDLRHLAIMDFLLEHFEEIPEAFFNQLCPQNPLH
jgi:hypothetical protein